MHNIIVIAGLTGSCKDEYVYSLNEKLKYPILIVDSMKIYRLMNIGTSKPDIFYLNRFNHFGIDIRNHWETFNVGEFFEYVNNIFCKFNHILVVAGSPMYLKIVLYGIFRENIDTKKIREKLLQQVNIKGISYFYQKLQKLDPDYAKKISPSDQKRIIRALEVIIATGKTFSQFHTHFKQKPMYKTLVIGILKNREIIKKNIIERTKHMIKKGLIDEVTYLMKIANFSLQSKEAIGYKNVIRFLASKGEKIEELEDSIIKDTLRYTKHQFSWFKKLVNVWIKDKEEVENIVYKFCGL